MTEENRFVLTDEHMGTIQLTRGEVVDIINYGYKHNMQTAFEHSDTEIEANTVYIVDTMLADGEKFELPSGFISKSN